MKFNSQFPKVVCTVCKLPAVGLGNNVIQQRNPLLSIITTMFSWIVNSLYSNMYMCMIKENLLQRTHTTIANYYKNNSQHTKWCLCRQIIPLRYFLSWTSKTSPSRRYEQWLVNWTQQLLHISIGIIGLIHSIQFIIIACTCTLYIVCVCNWSFCSVQWKWRSIMCCLKI